MPTVPPSIFKAYDIRGVDEKELTPDIAELIGRGYGTYLWRLGTRDAIIARDTRRTSEEYEQRLINGLLSTGVNAHHIGHAFTPTVYWSRKNYSIDGGVIVTASHNPPEYNGFKLCHGYNTMSGDEVQKIREIIQRNDFETGKGLTKEIPEANDLYWKALKNRAGKFEKPMRIVVDCTNGTSSLFFPKKLREMGLQVTTINETVDPSFPGHLPDPAFIAGYEGLQKKVVEVGADLGIMLDTDVDRVGFVDDRGKLWLGDMILILLSRDYLPMSPGAKVIVELKDSEAVVDEVTRLGGRPIFWKTGHSLLDEKVLEEKALLCGEMSCHYWITKDWYYFDDAPLAALEVIRIVSRSGKKLSELMEDIPQYFSTPEYRIHVPSGRQKEIVEEIVSYFKEKCEKYIDIDGIRGYIGDGWFLFRSSNTEPLVVLRIEARTKNGQEKLKAIIKERLDQIPEIKLDWDVQYK